MNGFHKLNVVEDSFFVGSADILAQGIHTRLRLEGIQQGQAAEDFADQIFFLVRQLSPVIQVIG